MPISPGDELERLMDRSTFLVARAVRNVVSAVARGNQTARQRAVRRLGNVIAASQQLADLMGRRRALILAGRRAGVSIIAPPSVTVAPLLPPSLGLPALPPAPPPPTSGFTPPPPTAGMPIAPVPTPASATTTRTAARERRAAEIEKLTELIDAGKTVLSITGLSSSTRNAVKADLIRLRSRRTRLRNLDATDFGGILKAEEVRQLEDLVKAARKEVQQKRLAAAFLGSVFKIGDLALTMAEKLAI